MENQDWAAGRQATKTLGCWAAGLLLAKPEGGGGAGVSNDWCITKQNKTKSNKYNIDFTYIGSVSLKF